MGAAGGAKRRRKEDPQPVYSVLVQPKAPQKDALIQAEQARGELWAAALAGDVAVVERILGAHGWDPGVVDAPSPTVPAPPAVDGDAPLAVACRAGHGEVVQLLLKAKGVDVNRVNEMSEEGGTPLTIVSENGNAALVRELLADRRADVNAPRSDGCTALFMASQNGHTDVVLLLLAAPGIDVDKPDLTNRFTPLIIAAYKGRHAAAMALLEAKADVDARTPKQYSALLIAVDRHDPVLHAALLMHGADASAVHSALFRACLMGTAVAARASLERCRARGRPPDEDARLPPLHVACMLGDEAGVEAALQDAAARGVNGKAAAACAVDASGLGALYYAVELGEEQAARLVLTALGAPASHMAKASRAAEDSALRTTRSSSGSGSTSGRPGTAPARQTRHLQKDGSIFFRTVVLPFFEDRIYVVCDGAKELLLAYLGSVAAARFFMRDEEAFRTLHALSVRGLRVIEDRLEGVFLREGLGDALGMLGEGVPRRPGGSRQDNEDLLPTFPEIHGYGPTATFYEDDYIDALQMLSCALDTAFYKKVDAALSGTECKLRHPSIKSRTRMRNKLGDPDDHLGKARPRPAHNIDTMRCAATFADARSLIKGFAALVQAFGTSVRVKNSFRAEFDPSKSYGYRSVMMNLRFDTGVTFEDVFGGVQDGEGGARAEWDSIAEKQASYETSLAMQRILREWFRHESVRSVRVAMAAEVQLILAPYLQARKESHLLYKVARCSGAAALVSDAAGRALAGREQRGWDLEAATKQMQERVSKLIEQRLKQVPEEMTIMSCTTIDLEDADDGESPTAAAGMKDIMLTLGRPSSKASLVRPVSRALLA